MKLTKPITVRHEGVDAVNPDTGRIESSTTSRSVLGGVANRSQVASQDGGLMVGESWLVFLPADTTVAAGDTLLIDGDEFVVESDPYAAWNQRKQAVSHLEMRVRKGSRT